MATKRIPKAERIGEAIRSLAARSRIYGQARQEYYNEVWASEAGEYCAHVAVYRSQDMHHWGRMADAAQGDLVDLTMRRTQQPA